MPNELLNMRSASRLRNFLSLLDSYLCLSWNRFLCSMRPFLCEIYLSAIMSISFFVDCISEQDLTSFTVER